MEDGLTKEEMELTNRLTARDPSNLTGFQNNQAFRFSERDHKMRDGGVILFTVGFKSQDRAGTRQQQGREINISEYNAAGFSRRTASSPFVRAETAGEGERADCHGCYTLLVPAAAS